MSRPKPKRKYAKRPGMPDLFPCGKHGPHDRIVRMPDGGYICACKIKWRAEITFVEVGRVIDSKVTA